MNRGADIWNSSVRSFPLVRICRTRSGSWNGSPLRKRSLISEKIAVFSPIPSASVRTAIKVNTGDLRSWRKANFRSFISSFSFHNPAVAQLNHPLSTRSIFLRVRDLNDGHAFVIELAKQLHDFFALTGVQITSGLVSKQKFRFSNNRPRNTDKLLLPSGKLTRIQIFFANDLETIERVGHQSGALTFAVMAIGERDIEVFVNREVVEQIILLEHEADLLVPQRGAFLRFQMMNRGFAQKKLAAPAVVVHSENVQQRRFACARGPHHRDKIALFNIQIDAAQDVKKFLLPERVTAFQIFQFNHAESVVVRKRQYRLKKNWPDRKRRLFIYSTRNA